MFPLAATEMMEPPNGPFVRTQSAQRFEENSARKSAAVCDDDALLRMGILLGIAFLLNTFLIDKALHLDKSFQLAVYTMFLLPPPFVIPIYMGDTAERQKPMILNTISLHVLCSLAAFVILVSVM